MMKLDTLSSEYLQKVSANLNPTLTIFQLKRKIKSIIEGLKEQNKDTFTLAEQYLKIVLADLNSFQEMLQTEIDTITLEKERHSPLWYLERIEKLAYLKAILGKKEASEC